MSHLSAMVKLAEVIVGAGGQASIAFSNIPQGYRSLQLMMQGRGDAVSNAVNITCQYNGDTASNYDWQLLEAAGTATVSDTGGRAQTGAIVAKMAGASAPSNAAGAIDLIVPNYAGTAFRKDGNSRSHYAYDDSGATGFLLDAHAFSWRSTAAITSILLFPSSGNFVQFSVASLYGVL